MKPTILLLNDTSENANWGCRATSHALRSLLESQFAHAQVRAVSMNPLHHAPRPLRRLIVAHAARSLLTDCPAGSMGRLIERWVERRLYGDLTGVHVERVVLNGEGTTHGYRGQTLRVLLPFYLANARHDFWTAAVNQTVAADDERARALFRAAYGRAGYLAVREPLSREALSALGLNDVRLAADAAFLLDPAPASEVDAWMEKLGLQPGFLALSGSATIESYPLERHRALVRRLSETYRCPIAFFAASNADRRRIKALAATVPMVAIPPSISPAVVAGLLGRASFLVTGRFHLLIFATLAGTPFVPLESNSFKIDGLLRSLSYPIPVSGPHDDVDRVMERAARVFGERDDLAERLRALIPVMRERARLNVAFDTPPM
jgi:polysaccharide pyruvyl transferase WcaK-like protein